MITNLNLTLTLGIHSMRVDEGRKCCSSTYFSRDRKHVAGRGKKSLCIDAGFELLLYVERGRRRKQKVKSS